MEKRKHQKIKYSKTKSWWHFHHDKKPAPSGFIVTFGKRGCGKSATIAKRYLKWLRKEQKKYSAFYSNVSFTIPNENSFYLDLTNHKLTDYLDPSDPVIQQYQCSTFSFNNPVDFFIKHDSIIALDELGIIAHSRDFKNFPQEFVKFTKILRKMGILMIANSQSYDIDKTLREGASDLRLQKKIFNLSYSRKINKWPDIVKSEGSAESQIGDQVEFAPIFQKDAIQLTYIPFYAGVYNSFI